MNNVTQNNPNPQEDEIPEETSRIDPYDNSDGQLDEILTFVALWRNGTIAHEASNPIIFEPGYRMPGYL